MDLHRLTAPDVFRSLKNYFLESLDSGHDFSFSIPDTERLPAGRKARLRMRWQKKGRAPEPCQAPQAINHESISHNSLTPLTSRWAQSRQLV